MFRATLKMFCIILTESMRRDNLCSASLNRVSTDGRILECPFSALLREKDGASNPAKNYNRGNQIKRWGLSPARFPEDIFHSMSETHALPAARRPDDTLISCVVPIYNEAAHLASFLQDLRAMLQTLAVHYEIIVVNDGSTDETGQVMAGLQQPGLYFLSLSRNFGKEAALSAGIDKARGDAVILIDGDYQHPLSLLPQMVDLWKGGIDMVYGVIHDRGGESRLKRWGTGMFYALLSSGVPITIPPNAGDFRLMDRKVVQALRQLPERNRFMKGLYAWVGFRVALNKSPLTP